jgi:hypothetical protein
MSADAADLIAKLLVADPQSRLTIPEIQAHPWFLRLDRIKGMKENADEEVTAFDIVAASVAPEGRSFSTNCPVSTVVEKLAATALLFQGAIQPGRDRYSLTVRCFMPYNDRVMAKFHVLPIDERCVIVSGTRLLGSEAGFVTLFRKVKELSDEP